MFLWRSVHPASAYLRLSCVKIVLGFNHCAVKNPGFQHRWSVWGFWSQLRGFCKVTWHLTGVGKIHRFHDLKVLVWLLCVVLEGDQHLNNSKLKPLKFNFEHFGSEGALVLMVDSHLTPFLSCWHGIKNYFFFPYYMQWHYQINCFGMFNPVHAISV